MSLERCQISDYHRRNLIKLWRLPHDAEIKGKQVGGQCLYYGPRTGEIGPHYNLAYKSAREFFYLNPLYDQAPWSPGEWQWLQEERNIDQTWTVEEMTDLLDGLAEVQATTERYPSGWKEAARLLAKEEMLQKHLRERLKNPKLR